MQLNLLLLVLMVVLTCMLTIYGGDAHAFPAKVATYNAFLGERFARYSYRKRNLMKDLKRRRSDVICLQETFYGDDISDIVQSVKREYPFSFSEIHQYNGKLKSGPPCQPSDLPVLTCIQANSCFSLPTQAEQFTCSVLKCSSFQSLSQNCLTCVALTADSSKIVDRCITAKSSFNTAGLMLLSKRPMTEMRKVEFHPGKIQLRNTGYLQAMVGDLGQVFCTHLRGYDDAVYFEINLPYSSYHEQQSAEVKTLLSATCDMKNAIIAGDFNAGPSISANHVSGEFESSYINLLRKGFVSPFVDFVGQCTFCVNNPLVSDWPTNVTIDHVMTKGYMASKAQRFFNGRVPLSDHYGVELTITGTNN